jgi:hypothetical protein
MRKIGKNEEKCRKEIDSEPGRGWLTAKAGGGGEGGGGEGDGSGGESDGRGVKQGGERRRSWQRE